MSSVNKVIVVGNLGRDPKQQPFSLLQVVEKIIHNRVGEQRNVDVEKLAVLAWRRTPFSCERLNFARMAVLNRRRSGCQAVAHKTGSDFRIRLRELHPRELRPDRYLIDPFIGAGGLL